ncbi:unnamed protein product [Peronospora belbahrii]|uniref:BUB protein kinase n=1 Tax=Peronospora belbahrii TaxID=622444 RepID=A0AAU9KQ39_9STRA|nr:unnamed protein product [Peronospora belbahrii]
MPMTTTSSQDTIPSLHKRKADNFEWETSKENVMPLKRGRNVADLNKSLRAHDSFQAKLRLEDEVKAKECAIAAYDGDDPLADWLEYVRWLEIKMPEDTRKKFKVLEKCTRQLKDNPRYRNDMRYIRLWIQYADLVSNPKDIFKYLYQNKIGERVSLFYIGWAYVLETMANYPQAHKIYLKASQKNAEPQDLLERKYKEFQRRMSRQWLRMTEENGSTSDIDEVTHRHALESLSTYGMLELNDAQRQQLQQHRASTRAQRVQKASAHKPVFIVYEDPVVRSVDPFGGNGCWKKLGTMQQQDKENELAPSTWDPHAVTNVVETSRHPERLALSTSRSHPDSIPLQVFVDDEFSVPENELKQRTSLTHRSQTLRQRLEGVATEEEMLAQEPLKNFTASDKKLRVQKQGARSRFERSCYDIRQITSNAGEAISFEEIRARAHKHAYDRRCRIGQHAFQNVTSDVESASNVAGTLSEATTAAPVSTASLLHKAATTRPISHDVKLAEHEPVLPVVAAAAIPSQVNVVHSGDQEDMTINTRVALEDINNMFCSPPRLPKTTVLEEKEGDPVERKLHFSVFDDLVGSVAMSAQDQSFRQEPNESVPAHTFQVFPDDIPEEPRTGRKTWSQKRKPLGARDDLVKSGRLTNKDALMHAEKEATAKESPGSHWIQGVTKNVAQEGSIRRFMPITNYLTPRNMSQPLPIRTNLRPWSLDPYTYENRQALILDRRVDLYLCSRPDAVKLHSIKLPRVPCNNSAKRKLRKPIVIKAGSTQTLQLVGELGSGSFAYVFSANVVDTVGNITCSKAVKYEKERQNLAWEFYVTNKITKILRDERKLPDDKIPVPAFSDLHLFPNGALLLMDKSPIGTLYDVLNSYKQSGVAFPEALAVYYSIKMLRCIELIHSAKVLHGDIKPDNWLITPGNPPSELCAKLRGRHNDETFCAGDLYLIDYGRSIDLNLYPDGTHFTGNCHVKGFQCVEMLTQRPWTYQVDTFAFCGTVHCMLFGDYMEVKPQRNSKGTTHWGIVRPFKRYWQVNMWKYLFHALLNVSSCTKQPSLSNLRRRLEDYFVSDTSRQQELVKQLDRQDRLLRKSTV